MARISVVVVLVVLMWLLASPMAALAKKPTNPNGWGTVVSQKATTYHDVGKHSSSQEEPRQGIGNVANDEEGGHVSDHGCTAGKMDDKVGADPDTATDCTGDPGRKR